jgi:glyoxylase-like metal-dependent hydrolase (beta-lactamase superfamily II)
MKEKKIFVNKSTKILLIACASIIFIVLAGMVTLFLVFSTEMKKFSSMPTGQVLPSVIAVNSGISNCFLVPDSQGTYIAIDAGTDAKKLRSEFEELKIDPQQVVAILCTHSDNDHVGGVPFFPKAEVIISEQEEQMVSGKTPRALGFMKNALPAKYRTVKTESVFSIGSHRISGISTPGHTPGSTCWVIDDTLLFSGDATGFEHGKAGLFSNLFNMDSKQQIKSIQNIKSIPGIKHIFTAHQGRFDYSSRLFN